MEEQRFVECHIKRWRPKNGLIPSRNKKEKSIWRSSVTNRRTIGHTYRQTESMTKKIKDSYLVAEINIVLRLQGRVTVKEESHSSRCVVDGPSQNSCKVFSLLWKLVVMANWRCPNWLRRLLQTDAAAAKKARSPMVAHSMHGAMNADINGSVLSNQCVFVYMSMLLPQYGR